ncbi:MAG: YncE family protein [Bacteroidales bacterium]|jgi:DNA-binding beta-propeller fold protein YncE|nr:YncE family protein [Bacteroidales bacterium]
MKRKIILLAAAAVFWLVACREEVEIFEPEVEQVAPPSEEPPAEEPGEGEDEDVPKARLLGFYLLNEGNMGSNKSTLDYMDLVTGVYHRNIFADANPSVPKELGDVGNDIGIYGSKLYAVINCSNKVEVMDKFTVRRLGQIDIPNCRYIRFHGGYAYVTSYAGPVELNPNYEQTGYVAKVDTATFQVIDRCLVGFQPDELEIVGDKIYVANSGGYMFPNYENTVSVIDISQFEEIKRIEVAINLHRLRADRHGNLWVSSRGDYYDLPSQLHWIDTQTDTYGGMLDIAATELYLDGDSLYLYGTEFSYNSYDWTISFGIIDVTTRKVATRNFLADGEERKIAMPYGIMVNPVNKDIYMTDAAGFTYPGTLLCFDRHGKKRWEARTGDIPGHFALLYE